MSYNGIGLSTARGTGTSGHVQANKSYVKPQFFRSKLQVNQSGFGATAGNSALGEPDRDSATHIDSNALRKSEAGKAVTDHAIRRKIEGKVYALRVELEDCGRKEDYIEAKCANLRSKLESEQQKVAEKREDGEDSSAVAAILPECWDWRKQGSCRHGDRCRYAHIERAPEDNSIPVEKKRKRHTEDVPPEDGEVNSTTDAAPGEDTDAPTQSSNSTKRTSRRRSRSRSSSSD